MSESYLPTDRLVTDLNRAITNLRYGTTYRPEVLGLRNKLRTRAEAIEERLAKGEAWFEKNATDPAFLRHEDTWLELLTEYVVACDAAAHAQEALS